jgi:hypothetical protein
MVLVGLTGENPGGGGSGWHFQVGAPRNLAKKPALESHPSHGDGNFSKAQETKINQITVTKRPLTADLSTH